MLLLSSLLLVVSWVRGPLSCLQHKIFWEILTFALAWKSFNKSTDKAIPRICFNNIHRKPEKNKFSRQFNHKNSFKLLRFSKIQCSEKGVELSLNQLKKYRWWSLNLQNWGMMMISCPCTQFTKGYWQILLLLHPRSEEFYSVIEIDLKSILPLSTIRIFNCRSNEE